MPSDVVLQEDPPVWLKDTLAKHQNNRGMCTCSYSSRNSAGEPRTWVHFSPEHQAEEVHKTLGEHLVKLINGT